MMMKNRILLSVVVLMVLLGSFLYVDASQAKVSASDDYVLVFSDEFNQKNGSRPDATKWITPKRDANVRWKRWVADDKRVCFIKNGALVCRAIKHKPDAKDTAKIWTGAVDTRQTYSFQYGKVEVRMRTNSKKGNSPAAWMSVSPKVKNARYGEIDIFESFNSDLKSFHTVHTHQSFILKKKGPQNQFARNVDVTQWHVYGMEWTPEYISWSVDGVQVGIYRKSNHPQQLEEGQWTFDEPFFLLLNQSLTGVAQISTVYETQFDWVRVYQKKGL